MCGRFVRRSDSARFGELFAAANTLELPPSGMPPSYNIAPSQAVLVARLDGAEQRELAALRWGLIPAWSKGVDNRYSMINARADTIASKPAYRSAYKQRRCLIAADGFYEWQRRESGKQPYYIHLAGAEPFALAGIWERWHSPGGEVIDSCAIITTEANELMATIHDRMPVILAPENYGTWLDPSQQPTVLLKPYPAELMDAYPVSSRANNPRNNSPELLEVVAA